MFRFVASCFIVLIFLPSIDASACVSLDENDYQEILRNPEHPLSRRVCPPESRPNPSFDRPGRKYRTPTEQVKDDDLPIFSDDLDFAGLIIAIDRQIKRYDQKNLNGTIRLGNDVYSLRQMKRTLVEFRKDVSLYKKCLQQKTQPFCQSKFRGTIRNKYRVYKPRLEPSDPRYGEENETFFTSYYTPSFDASEQETSEKPHGIYKKPQYTAKARSSRVEIDFKDVLKDKEHPLFWVDDLFDLYLLHVQGGGKVEIGSGRDKKQFYISYAGTNKRAFRFISRYMLQKKMISDGSIEQQREYLLRNPDRQEEIYAYCPSYVYFKISDHPPEGSDMVPLTDNRSIATDYRVYKFKGLLAFVEAQRPNETKPGFKPFSRFVLDQDTGGAIKGKARVDLYFGEGDYAEKSAYSISHTGNLYFLALKAN